MDRREQVFVSSTFIDLTEERQAVIQTLLQADCFPAGMELFPASDDEKWDLIKRVIEDSDYYIVVLGGRYGSTDEDGLSFTEKEFDYAVEVGKPVMGFVHGSPADIAAGKVDLNEDARASLAAFREKVGKRMVKYWTTADGLAGVVALSLIQTRKTHPAEGWIRASNALTPEVETELAQLREKVATLEREAESRDTAAARIANVEDIAQGEDLYSLATSVHYYTMSTITKGAIPYGTPRKYYWTTVELTWNDLLIELGPLLMNEASERTLDERLDTLARASVANPPDDAPDDFGQVETVRAGSEAFNDIKVQFFSLGLIQESPKRHPINDKNHYWTLTTAGKEALMRLRAIRRSRDDATTAVVKS